MIPAGSNRLGLALSGGGFRASFFHLGVLRRLAEFDLLRHVTTLSTVSGGSIVAAHYYLHFKQTFEAKRGKLTQQDYVDIVKKVEDEFIEGNAADLRNRLLMNPLTHVIALTTGRGYGRQMARLYTKHLYAKATKTIFADCPFEGSGKYAERGIPIHHAITRVPALADVAPVGRRLPNKSSGYPGEQAAASNLAEFNTLPGMVTIPHFVINATCLNTGGPFQFMLNEIGGSETGYIRYDELFMLLQLKVILRDMGDDTPDAAFLKAAMDHAVGVGTDLESTFDEFPETAFKTFPAHISEHVHFFLGASERQRTGYAQAADVSWLPEGWSGWKPESNVLRRLLTPDSWLAVQHLLGCDFGSLRRAKIASWYWLDEPGWNGEAGKKRGGFTRDDYLQELQREIERIDGSLTAMFDDIESTTSFAYLVCDLYYLRSAVAIGWNAPDALRELTLSDAVAASANFPPVFTPFTITGLFDHDRFHLLSLTDGGVHDNQGIEAVIDDRAAYLIASDAGGLVLPEPQPPEARVPMMNRIIDVLMGGIRRAQMRSIDETCRVANLLPDPRRTDVREDDLYIDAIDHLSPAYSLRRVAVFHMTSNPLEAAKDGLKEFEPVGTAHIRTDLDAFSELEVAALRYQGYQLADRYTRWFVESSKSPYSAGSKRPALNPPADLLRMPDTAADILRGSQLLAGRFTRVHPWLAVGLSAIFGVVFYLLRFPSLAQLKWLWDYKVHWSLLDIGLKQPRAAVVSAVKTAKVSWHAAAAGWTSNTSIVAILLFCWAAYAIGGHLWRKASEHRKREMVSHVALRRRAKLLTVGVTISRWPNIVSLVGLVMFVFTLNVKWLAMFLPLWSLPAMLIFLIAFFVFTPLWKRTGRLKPREAVLPSIVFDGSPSP